MGVEEDNRRFSNIEECIKEIKADAKETKTDIEKQSEHIVQIKITTSVQDSKLNAIDSTFTTIKNWVIIFVMSNIAMFVVTKVAQYWQP